MQVPASSAPKEKLPVGAQVQLSNGMLAKVLEVTDEQPLAVQLMGWSSCRR